MRIPEIIERNQEYLDRIIESVQYMKEDEDYTSTAKLCDEYAQFLCDSVYDLESNASMLESSVRKFAEETELREYSTKEIRKIKTLFSKYAREFEQAQKNGEMPTALNFFNDEIEFMLGTKKY